MKGIGTAAAAVAPPKAPGEQGATPAAASAPADAPTADPSRDQLIADLVDSVVLITALDGAGNEVGAGSGFIVDASGLAATNYHVLAQAASATAKFRDNTVCKIAGARAFAADADLAIVLRLCATERAMGINFPFFRFVGDAGRRLRFYRAVYCCRMRL